jgi:Spy/CpxP family protein refolding chaperone
MERLIMTTPPRFTIPSSARLTVGSLIVAVAAAVALPAMAQGPGHGPMHAGHHGARGHDRADGPLGGRMLERLLDRVKATDTQRTEVRRIAEAAQKDLRAQHESARGERAALVGLLAQPEIDPAAVEAQRRKDLARHEQASKRMTQAMLDIAKVLTPAQRAQVAEEMRQRSERMGERMGPRGERGMPPADRPVSR